MARICRGLEICRLNRDSKQREKGEKESQIQIVELTKRYAALVCWHYFQTNIWEPDFADMIFKNPTKAFIVMDMYANGIRRQSKANET